MTLDSFCFQASNYLSYLLASQNAHGLHSPYMFKLYQECISNEAQIKAPLSPWEHHAKLLKDHEEIYLQDYGAGSGGKVLVSQIAKRSTQKPKFAHLLYRLSTYYQPDAILELGTSFGISTQFLAMGNPNAKVYTFEGDQGVANIARKGFKKAKLDKIEIVLGDIGQTLASKLQEIGTINLAYIDANHTYSALCDYVQMIEPYMHEEGVIVLDDIYWSKGMKKAWLEIVESQKFGFTADLFKVGLLFKRTKQTKQHFVFRF